VTKPPANWVGFGALKEAERAKKERDAAQVEPEKILETPQTPGVQNAVELDAMASSLVKTGRHGVQNAASGRHGVQKPDVQKSTNWTSSSDAGLRPEPSILDVQNDDLWTQVESEASTGTEAAYPSRRYKARLTLRLPEPLITNLDTYCHEERLSRQDAIETAIREFLRANWTPGRPETGRPETGRLDVQASRKAHDHDDDEKMIIYQQLTGNRISERDRIAVREVANFSLDDIREGVRLSVERAPSPVKSFRYCIGAIREVAERGSRAAKPERPRAVAPAANIGTADVLQKPLTVYDVRTIAQRFRELHKGEPDYTKERLRADVRTAMIGEGLEPDEKLIEDAIGA
jgi:hypothetical protein